MEKMKHTTVNLTQKAQNIKEDLAPIYGLKNILSAGLILFGKLSSDLQKDTIHEANHEKDAQKCPACGHILLKKRMSKKEVEK